jgi:hypothetical protein
MEQFLLIRCAVVLVSGTVFWEEYTQTKCIKYPLFSFLSYFEQHRFPYFLYVRENVIVLLVQFFYLFGCFYQY